METRIILEQEYYPSGDKLLLIERPDGLYIEEQMTGNINKVILCCTGERALSASVDFYQKHYNTIKHTLYPSLPCPEHKFEEYKESNFKLYESIEKKYECISHKESLFIDTCMAEYNQCQHY